jgi:hypothetical protein
MNDPILAQKTRTIKNCEVAVLTVYGGLYYIKDNSAPYFSLTCDYPGGRGADHARILSEFPEFADLAALHLSNMDGTPIHAAENAFYHMGGCTEFRPGNLYYTAGREPPYGPNFKHAAGLLRITEAEARQLQADLFGDSYSETGGFLSKSAEQAAQARLAEWCETQKPRWKAEAEACIKKHNLRVYGDKWPA